MENRKITSPLNESVIIDRGAVQGSIKSNIKGRSNKNVVIESETHYVLTNLKKNKRVEFGNYSPEPSSPDKTSPTVLGRLSDKGTYSGLVKTKDVNGDACYKDISEWWKTHKNILKRAPEDMGALNYEGYPSMWDMLTTAITVSNADESKQLKSSMPFLKNGQSEGHMFGY